MTQREERLSRQRVPAPLIPYRLPSGRGAIEQPNAIGDGAAALDGRFWIAAVVTGFATGLCGVVLMLVLFSVQHAAFGYHSGEMQAAVERLKGFRRVAPLLVAGVIGGIGWTLLRRFTPGEQSEIDDAIWNGDGQLSLRRSIGSSLISELVIGLGASIGREAAPKLLGGVSGSLSSKLLGLTSAQRRLLVACGGGAGLAAVYNVPIGGALFAAEILVGSLALPVVLPALACSLIATVVGWIYLPDRPTYIDIPAYHSGASVVVWALIIGPLVGLVSAAYIRVIGTVSHKSAKGNAVLVTPLLAFGVLALIGLRYPELFGNGKDMAHSAFLGEGSIALVGALFVLKPLVTTLCLGSGASGGLFTPVLSTGAMLGGFLGLVWQHLWSGGSIGAFAMVGAAAMIAASMQAPLTGIVLVLELTHTGFALIVPIATAVVLATLVARQLDGYSIYTARLPAAKTSSIGIEES